MQDEVGSPGLISRIFGSFEYFRLWQAQLVTSLGDWIGFLALALTAARVGGETPGTALGLVIAARLVPGFFFGQLGGVLADRWDRCKVMVVCDVCRAGLFALLPFVDELWQLIVASLVIEAFTLLWIPSKEALMPTLLPEKHIATANSLSLGATYGTFPVAAAAMLGLTQLGKTLEKVPVLNSLRIDEESLGFYCNTITFLGSAFLVASLAKMLRDRRSHRGSASATGQPATATADSPAVQTEPKTDAQPELAPATGTDNLSPLKSFMKGWRFIVLTPVVRAVNFGLATALFGGGLLIPLGIVYAVEALDGGQSGYATLQTALGSGVGLGVLIISLVSRKAKERFHYQDVFMIAVFGAGVSLILAATFSIWAVTIIFVTLLGVFGGFVYVMGFTILHIAVGDELRGRIFSSLYSLVRLSVALSLVVAPHFSTLFDYLVPSEVELFGYTLGLPGVRLTLWFGGLIILGSAFFILKSFRLSEKSDPNPSQH